MKKAIGIGIALCIMMSLAVVLAGAGEEDKAKDVVVQWKGTGTYVGNTSADLPGYLAGLVPTGDEECEAIFKVDMLDPTTGRRIGTGYDYITHLNLSKGVATTCYIFDFSRSGHDVIISKNNLTLQPVVIGCESLTHILGSFPDEDTIKDGTGEYKNVKGRVRASGGVNFTSKEFDHLFVITLVVCNVAPEVTVTYPTTGTVGGTITVTANASDADGNVTQVAFYLMPGDTLIDTDAHSAAAGEWSVPLNTTTFTDGIGYQIKAIATDNGSATNESTGGAFEIDNSCQCDFCYPLEEGWNFVSIPKKINGSNTPANVFNLSDLETCWTYDGCVGGASGWLSNSNIPGGIKPCKGYWVYKVADDTLCVDFDQSTRPSSTPPTYQLCTGWNLIGHIETSLMPVDDGSSSDFGSMTTLEGKFAQLWTIDGIWKCYEYGEFGYMTPGKAYWILMTEDATMSGTL